MQVIRIDKNSDTNAVIESLLQRTPNYYDDYMKKVQDIIKEVKEKKDEAIIELTERFDGVTLDKNSIKVTKEEIEEAYNSVDPELLRVIRKAKDQVEKYHIKQKKYSWFDNDEKGTMVGQKITPIKYAGVYVPGGKAVYPSSVIMNIMPAKVAGVENIVMVSPPRKDDDDKINPLTLVTANECGVDAIYKVGGAQAIAALAYGTETIPKVDKIVGPGNIFVALAKKAVYGHVSIDSIAGP
ncbi:MAG: histidinol dehydrogenase, partial [bacterium]